MNIITPIMSPNVILERLKTVDGAGSGLDADTVDTYHASALAKLSGGNTFFGDQIINGNLQVYPDSTNKWLDVLSGQLLNTTDDLVVDWQNKKLKRKVTGMSGSSKTIYDWELNRIYEGQAPSNVLSADFLNRILYDTSGAVKSVDYGTRQFYDIYETNVANWANDCFEVTPKFYVSKDKDNQSYVLIDLHSDYPYEEYYDADVDGSGVNEMGGYFYLYGGVFTFENWNGVVYEINSNRTINTSTYFTAYNSLRTNWKSNVYPNRDELRLTAYLGGTGSYYGEITNAAFSANRTYTLPDSTGTFALINSNNQLPFSDGTVSLPSFTFASDLNTGFYRIGADNFGISAGGVKVAEFDNNTFKGIKSDYSIGLGGATYSRYQYGVKTAGTSYYFGNFENVSGTSAGVSKTGVKLLEFFDADSSVLANVSLRAGAGTAYVNDYTFQIGTRPLDDTSTLQWINGTYKFNLEMGNTGIYSLYSYTSGGTIWEITPNATLNLGITNFKTRLQNSSGTIKKITSVTSAAGSTNVTVSDDAVVVIGSTTHTLVITDGSTEYGRYHTLKNLSTGNVTINRSGSNTFDGATSLTLTQNQSVKIVYVSSDTWAVL